MLLFWRIRYLDSNDRQFKDRDLRLNTADLDCVTKARVELCYELAEGTDRRAMLRFRELFVEEPPACNDIDDHVAGFSLIGYFEDENGAPLCSSRMAEILDGDTPVMRSMSQPPQAAPSAPQVLELEKSAFSEKEMRVLEYCCRDLEELDRTALMTDGPGCLRVEGDGPSSFRTAITHAEIVASVTTFRRLYMKGEFGSITNAASLYSRRANGHWSAMWVKGGVESLRSALDNPPDYIPGPAGQHVLFTRKSLIDAFIYTRYAHQPEPHRKRLYDDCLAAVGGDRELLAWLFLRAMFECAIHMMNTGSEIVRFFRHHVERHALPLEGLASLEQEHSCLGILETKAERRIRVIDTKAHQLALELCGQAGETPDRVGAYLERAKAMLADSVPLQDDLWK